MSCQSSVDSLAQLTPSLRCGSALGFPVELMKNAMSNRSENESGGDEKDQALIQSVGAGEDFARRGDRGVHRPHSSKEHCCV